MARQGMWGINTCANGVAQVTRRDTCKAAPRALLTPGDTGEECADILKSKEGFISPTPFAAISPIPLPYCLVS